MSESHRNIWISRSINFASFESEYSIFYRDLLQKRPMIFRSLLMSESHRNIWISRSISFPDTSYTSFESHTSYTSFESHTSYASFESHTSYTSFES